MIYKLVDKQGKDIIEEINKEHDTLEEIVKSINDITIANQAKIHMLNSEIKKQNETIIKLQEQLINSQSSTIIDIVKNSFKKKSSNIKQSTIEIDD